MDWDRLVRRFGAHWRILLAHLVIYGFIYPSDRTRVPARVVRELLDRLASELDAPGSPETVCPGTLLSRAQYLNDVESGGYTDARLEPHGTMSPEEVAIWTRAISEEQPEQKTTHVESGASEPVPALRTAQ